MTKMWLNLTSKLFLKQALKQDSQKENYYKKNSSSVSENKNNLAFAQKMLPEPPSV